MLVQELPERIESKIDVTTNCWEWNAAATTLGYGKVWWEGRQRMAYRVIWELLVGPLGDLEIDHLCRNPRCVNPDHLEPVTHAENMQRSPAGSAAGQHYRNKTHCPQGHEYSGDNVYPVPLRSGRTGRGCILCRRAHSTNSARRHRASTSTNKGR